MLAIGYSTGEISIINAKSGDVIAELSKNTKGNLFLAHSGKINSLTFGKLDNSLYTAGNDNKINKWNLETKQITQTWTTTKDEKKQAGANFLTISNSEKYLFGAVNSIIKVWNLMSEVISILLLNF